MEINGLQKTIVGNQRLASILPSSLQEPGGIQLIRRRQAEAEKKARRLTDAAREGRHAKK